jgi:hypothetical protein
VLQVLVNALPVAMMLNGVRGDVDHRGTQIAAAVAGGRSLLQAVR